MRIWCPRLGRISHFSITFGGRKTRVDVDCNIAFSHFDKIPARRMTDKRPRTDGQTDMQMRIRTKHIPTLCMCAACASRGKNGELYVWRYSAVPNHRWQSTASFQQYACWRLPTSRGGRSNSALSPGRLYRLLRSFVHRLITLICYDRHQRAERTINVKNVFYVFILVTFLTFLNVFFYFPYVF